MPRLSSLVYGQFPVRYITCVTPVTMCSPSKILFLAADEYHADCFSVAEEIYEREVNHLKNQGLVEE
jgi:hypothetical protein